MTTDTDPAHSRSEDGKSAVDVSAPTTAPPGSERGDDAASEKSEAYRTQRSVRFWLVFLAICISTFLTALEYSAVATALPVIVHALDGDDFTWVASAYALASTAFLPASGALSQVFGRRNTLLGFIAMFSLGSALCGAAQNMSWLIAARTIQGAGGGGIQVVATIVLSDLVPLRLRGVYDGLSSFTWGVASAVAPIVGGALANNGQWRWLFYLNLPIAGVAALLVVLFLRVPTPQGTLKSKLSNLDWIGNGLIIASTTSVIIPLSWGGLAFPWSSPHTLVPLLVGIAGIAGFLAYEAKVAATPLIPWSVISHRTSISGYVQTFVAPLVTYTVTYFMPIYFQACHGASPIRSGVDTLSFVCVVGPVLIAAGVSVAYTRAYRPQIWLGWAAYLAGVAALASLDENSGLGSAAGALVPIGLGTGILYSLTYFPVLAPIRVEENAYALAFFAFCRTFAGVWAVTIGTAVLQTQLSHRLPASFTDQFPGGVAIAYSAIPVIPSLPEPLQSDVKTAFAASLRVLWYVTIGLAGLGALASAAMQGMQLSDKTDEAWALEKEGKREEGEGEKREAA